MLRARRVLLGLVALALTVAVAAVAQPAAGPPLESVANPRTTYGGWVTDPSGVLGATRVQIDALLGALNRETGAEVAVVVLPTIGGGVPKNFATALFKHWGVGRKGHDDGVLVLQVLDQRRVEIETGYGVEGALPDVKCAWLIRDAATPRLREGDFGGGQLALTRGIAYAIRNPNASQEALLSAALGQASATRVAADTVVRSVLQAPGPSRPSRDLRWPLALSLAACLAVLGGAWALRLRAHAALYLRSEFRPDAPLVIVVIGLAFTAFFVLFVSLAVSVQVGLGLGNVAVLVMTAVLGRNTITTFARARRRYAPRTCSACGGALALINDKYDDSMLDDGRAAEERIGAVNYDVWRCGCGKLSIEEFEVTAGARRCPKCSYRTQQIVRSEVLKRASTSSTGLRKLYLKCEHCKAEDTEEQVIPRESSGSSSSSRGGGGSSFGGGRSGGGGAGGSY